MEGEGGWDGACVERWCVLSFLFGRGSGRWRGAHDAGSLGSLFNQNASPNINFDLNTTNYTIRYETLRRVSAGEELCIHKAPFDGGAVEEGSLSAERGLEGVATRIAEKRLARSKWDEEIVPLAELEWAKVTAIIDSEDQTLTTCTSLILLLRFRSFTDVFFTSS